MNYLCRLSGRLPFDVEEDCSKHQLLIAMINKGFTAEISSGLGPRVSVEARSRDQGSSEFKTFLKIVV